MEQWNVMGHLAVNMALQNNQLWILQPLMWFVLAFFTGLSNSSDSHKFLFLSGNLAYTILNVRGHTLRYFTLAWDQCWHKYLLSVSQRLRWTDLNSGYYIFDSWFLKFYHIIFPQLTFGYLSTFVSTEVLSLSWDSMTPANFMSCC